MRLTAKICGVLLLWSSGIHAGGFFLDVRDSELERVLGEKSVKSLAVGESGYITESALCLYEGHRLNVAEYFQVSTKRTPEHPYRVTKSAENKVKLTLVGEPGEEEKTLVYRFVGRVANNVIPNYVISTGLWKTKREGVILEFQLYDVESINGHATLSELIKSVGGTIQVPLDDPQQSEW